MKLVNRRLIGQRAEEQASQFLQAQGLRLMMQNFHCYYGEIDLIMLDKDDVVFVEVRSRETAHYGSAIESINKNKIRKIIRTANHFLQAKKWLYQVNSRFDVVALHSAAGEMQLEWIKNAFLLWDDDF